MKILKKLTGIVLAMCMVLTVSGLTVMAAKPDDTAVVSVTGLDENATVTLYKIADATYNDAGDTFTGYDYLEGASFANEAEPTSQEINRIAAAIQSGALTPESISTTITGGTASATVGIGRYIAIVTSTDTSYVYNPILLTAGYKLENDDEVIYGGSVAVSDTYKFGEKAVAKSSTVDVEKGSEGWTPDPTADDESKEKQTAGVGDVIHYTVTPDLPVYPEEATNKTYIVTDTMSEGLTFVYESLTVVLGDETLTLSADNTFVNAAGDVIGTATQGENGYMIVFDYEKLGGQAPVIKYDGIVNDKAVIGTAEGNVNDVTLYFSNNPTQGETWEPTEIPDENTELPNGVTHKEDQDIIYTYRISFIKTDDAEGENAKRLEGAVFGIYADEACTQLIDTVVTNEDGFAESAQVAAGTYYLKEISAPAGYTINEQVYTIEASLTSSTKTTTATTTVFEYTDNEEEKLAGTEQVGWLVGHKSVAADGTVTTVYAYVAMDQYTAGGDYNGLTVVPAYIKSATTTTESNAITTVEDENGAGVTLLEDAVKNTELGELPSTGGSGVYLFIIIGVAIMSTIAFVFIRGRRTQA